MSTNKKNALAVIDDFSIAKRFEGMDEETLAELEDELADLDEESGIICRKIKIPSGGGLAYEVQNEDDDVDYMKEIIGVIVFTHRMNGYWPGSYGAGDGTEDKLPTCSSMDGKTGLDRDSGELRTCASCPFNQFGSADNKGKACKNMRRLYIMMNGDPNFYLLTVPPTSIKEVNKQLTKIMGSKGVPYTGLIVSLKLEKTANSGGVAYSKVVIEKHGLLSAEVSAAARELRAQIKAQYQNMTVTMEDYANAVPVDINISTDDYVSVPDDEYIPLPDEPPGEYAPDVPVEDKPKPIPF